MGMLVSDILESAWRSIITISYQAAFVRSSTERTLERCCFLTFRLSTELFRSPWSPSETVADELA